MTIKTINKTKYFDYYLYIVCIKYIPSLTAQQKNPVKIFTDSVFLFKITWNSSDLWFVFYSTGNKDPLPYTAPKGDPAARSPGSRHYSPFSESTWRPQCTPGSTKRFPHPNRCAQYYDCGGDPKEDWWGKHLRECPYPTVYDTTTGSCEYYTTVNCGQRKMPLDPCKSLEKPL